MAYDCIGGIVGDALTSIFGGGSNTDTSSTATGSSKELDDLRTGILKDLFKDNTLSSYAGSKTDTGAYTPTAATDKLVTDANNTDTSNLMSLDDYKKAGYGAAADYVNRISTPAINSAAALQGLESGGATQEAIANASAKEGLDFVKTLPQASKDLTLAGPQAKLLNSESAAALFPLTDQSRSLEEKDLLRQQGVLETGLTGLPFTPSTTGTSDKSSQPLFNWFGQG